MPTPQKPPRLVLFSGLGVGPDMMAPQRRLPGVCVDVPPWVDLRDGEPLPDFARRMAACIDPTPPLVLGGMSLGAMVALEAAHVLRPAGVLMISGAFTGDALGWSVWPLQWAAPMFPVWSVDLMLRMAPLAFWQFHPLPPPARGHLTRVIRRGSPAMFRWGARAVVDWSLTAAPPCPVRSIHGSVDQIIPIDTVHPTEVVRGGGHLVHLTHAAQVNRFLVRWTRGLSAEC